MSFLSRLRSIPKPKTSQLLLLRFLSSPSSILSPDSKTPLFSHQKSRAALSLLKSESNPSRIIDICNAAFLTPSFHIDRIAFSVAISKLSKSNNFQFIREFLEESKTRPDLKNESFFCHAIVLYGQANMIEDAKRTFKEMGESGMGFTTRALNSLLFACILAKDYGELKRIYVEFPKSCSITPDLDTYNHVIKSFAESGSTSSSYSVLAEMDRKGVRPNAVTFGNMLAGFYKEERMEDVGKVLNLMEDYKVKKGLSIYNIRIQSLCKLKKSYEAKGLLDAMLLKGMKPNSVTYTHLIHGYCSEVKYDEAKELFRSMVNKGCKPESDCYFTLIYFLCVGKDFESALNVCKESMEKNWIPNFATMKLLVNGLAGVGKVDEAKQLLKEVKDRFSKNTHLWDEVEAALPQ